MFSADGLRWFSAKAADKVSVRIMLKSQWLEIIVGVAIQKHSLSKIPARVGGLIFLQICTA